MLQPRALRIVRHADPDPRPHRDRGVGRPHGRAVGAARRRAGLPVREPRRGDRRHPRPPARPDLRLPLRHPAHDGACSRRSTARAPDLFARILDVRAGLRARHPPGRALDRVRAVRRALAARGAPAAAPPRRRLRRDDRRRARRARPALPAAAARRRRALRLPHPVHRGVAPGAGARAVATAVRLHLQLTSPAPRGRQAQVPRRIRGRHGRLDRRRPARDLGRPLRDAVETIPEATR